MFRWKHRPPLLHLRLMLYFSSSRVYSTLTLTWFASVFVRGTKLEFTTEISVDSSFCEKDSVTLMNIINLEKAIATLVKNAGVVGSKLFFCKSVAVVN